MAMEEPDHRHQIEPRWPVALAILAVLFMLAVLPGRVRVFPAWVPYAIALVVFVPMAATRLSGAKPRWILIERWTVVFFFVVVGAGTLRGLAYLIHEMVNQSLELSGLQLLTSSIAVWVTNVLMFTLLYWQMDRGGPEARLNHKGAQPDWLFPQTNAAENMPVDWKLSFVDYLFLGYSTATTFSTTDVIPLTSRAKLLMMLESMISLVTILVVAARAINVLGG